MGAAAMPGVCQTLPPPLRSPGTFATAAMPSVPNTAASPSAAGAFPALSARSINTDGGADQSCPSPSSEKPRSAWVHSSSTSRGFSKAAASTRAGATAATAAAASAIAASAAADAKEWPAEKRRDVQLERRRAVLRVACAASSASPSARSPCARSPSARSPSAPTEPSAATDSLAKGASPPSLFSCESLDGGCSLCSRMLKGEPLISLLSKRTTSVSSVSLAVVIVRQ
mmetsp:Transcript_10198/g.23281  ORF Transcript_10198/g.23281 Transcript_10198/m.23281 type:complete len:228 (+) Transcript_10198:157-840(+)